MLDKDSEDTQAVAALQVQPYFGLFVQFAFLRIALFSNDILTRI